MSNGGGLAVRILASSVAPTHSLGVQAAQQQCFCLHADSSMFQAVCDTSSMISALAAIVGGPHRPLGSPIRVGLEVHVARWHNGL